MPSDGAKVRKWQRPQAVKIIHANLSHKGKKTAQKACVTTLGTEHPGCHTRLRDVSPCPRSWESNTVSRGRKQRFQREKRKRNSHQRAPVSVTSGVSDGAHANSARKQKKKRKRQRSYGVTVVTREATERTELPSTRTHPYLVIFSISRWTKFQACSSKQSYADRFFDHKEAP